jgi:hypothetical protein
MALDDLVRNPGDGARHLVCRHHDRHDNSLGIAGSQHVAAE